MGGGRDAGGDLLLGMLLGAAGCAILFAADALAAALRLI